MGCASSAPSPPENSPSAHSNYNNHTDDNGKHADVEDSENIIEKNATLKINNYIECESKPESVLPSCDNVEQPLDVETKNNGSALPSPQDDLVIVDLESKEQPSENKLGELDDVQKVEEILNVIKASNLEETPSNEQDRDKEIQYNSKKFKEVVEDVVKITDVTKDESNTDAEQNSTSIPFEVTPIEIKELETEQDEMDEEILSAGSEGRATRWEALADIAAELPPSITVDPLTGQIYSLSK